MAVRVSLKSNLVSASVFKKLNLQIWIPYAGGLVLVHTTFGDLLRSLEPRESYGSPQNIVLSREALAAVHYQKGNIVTYTVNGKTMRHVNHSDNIHVNNLLPYVRSLIIYL